MRQTVLLPQVTAEGLGHLPWSTTEDKGDSPDPGGRTRRAGMRIPRRRTLSAGQAVSRQLRSSVQPGDRCPLVMGLQVGVG
jgi:hypothetical protein